MPFSLSACCALLSPAARGGLAGLLAVCAMTLSACDTTGTNTTTTQKPIRSLAIAAQTPPPEPPSRPERYTIASTQPAVPLAAGTTITTMEPSGVVHTETGDQVLKPAPVAVVSPFPPLPTALPQSATARVELLTRPPLAPPLRAHEKGIWADQDNDSIPDTQTDTPSSAAVQRCRDALFATRTLVEQPLILPLEQLSNPSWKEQALRGSELAQLACRGQRGEDAATYWRATAFLLHGQYNRAALYYGRIAENTATRYDQWGYVKGLARMLDACAKADRDALDAWTLAGILEARGETGDARLLYHRAERARCEALRLWSKARIAVTSG